MHNQKRGGKFWLWADCLLKAEGHQVHLQKGSSIDVQARINREGCTQMFIGVYDACGNVLCEEFYSRLSGDTVDEALSWGLKRCDVLVDQSAPFKSPHRIQADVAQSAQTPAACAEVEDIQRESYLRASRRALAEYAAAKATLMSIMRDRNSTALLRREHARRLNLALDAWAALPRQYVNSTGNALAKKTPEQASSFGGQLFVEELEHDSLGVSLPGIQAR